MARNSAGAVQLLEDSVHLLRAVPFATLAWHWVGSLPMAAGAVFFWMEITHPRAASSRLAADSLLLAALYAWLCICRAVFASRLRDHLAEVPARTVSLRQIAPAQILIGATKLIAFPLALVSGVLLSSTVGFYRNAAVLASQENRAGELWRLARRYTGHRAAQAWKLLGLIVCLYGLALVNVLIALAMLPQLSRVLSGYETAYSRLGAQLLEDPLFWSLGFAATWLVMDPFVQAIYCLRCFQAQSAESGEDIRAALRRLAPAGVAALVLVVCGAASLHAESVPPPALDRAVKQAAQSPEYDWRIPAARAQAQKPNWFVSATDRVVAALRTFLNSVSDAIGRLLRWIFGSPEPTVTGGGPPPSTALPAGIWLVIALLLGAAGYAFVRARYRTQQQVAVPSAAATSATPQDAEEADPLRFPEQVWLDLAERALAEQNWRLAVRAFYLANLGWMGRREYLRIHPGKTNREYEAELRRRTRGVPGVREAFSGHIAVFERVWYGMHGLSAEEVEHFRGNMRTLQQQLEAAS